MLNPLYRTVWYRSSGFSLVFLVLFPAGFGGCLGIVTRLGLAAGLTEQAGTLFPDPLVWQDPIAEWALGRRIILAFYVFRKKSADYLVLL